MRLWAAVVGVFLAGWTACGYAETTTLMTIKLQGTIPQQTTFKIDGVGDTTAQSEPSSLFGASSTVMADPESAYSKGEVEVRNIIRLTGIQSNSPVYLQIRSKGWTLPEGYDTSRGQKRTDGSDGQLLLKVRSSHAQSGVLTVLGRFNSEYVPIGAEPINILKIGEIDGQGHRTGAKGGIVELDSKMLLDPTYDLPGTYSISLEVTISGQQ